MKPVVSTAERAWLERLDLVREPFGTKADIGVSLINAQTVESTTTRSLWVFPNWVRACFLTANAQGNVTSEDEGQADHVAREWRGFLLLLEKDPVMRDAIDSLDRLGKQADVTRGVGEMFAEFVHKMQNAGVINKVRQTQIKRARRISGQGPGEHRRPSDAEFYREALPKRTR